MPPSPTVSIIIPTYNRADLLPEAINSVLSQSHANLEVIVVDDGSTDTTAQVMAAYGAEKRLTYIYQPNQGRAVARNYGAALASGEYLGFLDSDDLYLPICIASHLAMFQQRPEIGITIGGYSYLSNAGRVVSERCPWEETNGRLDLKDWLFNCLAMPGSVLMRKSWFERIGGFDSYCEIAEDWDLFLRLSVAGCGMAWVNRAVCQYRIHTGNSIQNLAKHCQGSLHSLEKLGLSKAIEPAIAQLVERAKASVHINYARKALALARIPEAIANLNVAVALYPALIELSQVDLWENMLTPIYDFDSSAVPSASQLMGYFKNTSWRVNQNDIIRAAARVEMRQFFLAQKRGSPEQAAQHLRAGLSLDMGWLANRGVLAFYIKRLFKWL